MSFGFSVPPNGDVWSSDNTGATNRLINTASLSEISIVSNPAYTSTSVDLRSCPSEIRTKIRLRSELDGDEEGEDENCDCLVDSDGNHLDDDCHCDEDDEDRSLSRSEVRIALANLR